MGRYSSSVELYEDILHQITGGTYRVGDKLPTERELAAAMSCSRATLGKALSRLGDEGFVERRTRAGTRVVSTARRNGLPAGGLDAVAFIHPGETHEAIERIVHGFQGAATQARYRVVTLTTGLDFKKEADLMMRLQDFGVRGAAVYPVVQGQEERMYFEKALACCSVPLVQTAMILPVAMVPSVDADYLDAGYQATRHLLVDCGLRHVGFHTKYAWTPRMRDCYQGYRRAFSERGLPVEESLVKRSSSMIPNFEDPLQEPTDDALSYLREHRAVEGIVAASDYQALGFLRAAKQLGLSVPEDVQIIGVDGLAMARESAPSLTSYATPFEKIGERAFDCLRTSMEGGRAPDDLVEIGVQGACIVRESTLPRKNGTGAVGGRPEARKGRNA